MNNLDQIFDKDPAVFADHYLKYLGQVLSAIDRNQIARFVEILLEAREREATVYFIGNGGSAATASHFANDLGIGTRSSAKPFRVVSLCDNQAVITAIANDFGYEDIFSRQLAMLAHPGDVVVAISASGNSPNLVKAFAWADENNLSKVALTAFTGGKLREMADCEIYIPTVVGEYGPAEDGHMIIDHLVANFYVDISPMANRNSTSRFINLGPIYLRSLCENDLDGSWYHWFNDPEITRFQDKGFFPNNLRKQTKYYEKIVDSTEDVVLAMVDASDEVHFGNSGLHSINWIHRTATLGIVIGLKEYQGKGYGKLAWQGLTDYGFHVLGLEKINATIFEGNESSKKCAESAGFAIEGRLESQFYKAGTRHHALLYGLTREKWSVKP